MTYIVQKSKPGSKAPPERTWRPVGPERPAGDILAWTEGRPVVGSMFIDVREDGTKFEIFLDVLGNEVLPWPSHWMPLPQPPQVSV